MLLDLGATGDLSTHGMSSSDAPVLTESFLRRRPHVGSVTPVKVLNVQFVLVPVRWEITQ